MQELISMISVGTEKGATKEQRDAGVAACRAILTALDTEPGQPLAIPSATPVQAMPRVSLDQVLDLMIARLSVLAKEREQEAAVAASVAPVRMASGSRGFRVPMVPSRSTNAAVRAAGTRSVPLKTASRTINARSVGRKQP